MFRTAQTFSVILILAGAAVLVTPRIGQAQPHGGGGAHFGGGGAHFGGGGHIGAAHIGGFHGGISPGGISHGGFSHGGISHGGFHNGSPYRHYGYGYNRPYVGYSGGYYPYYGLYGTYPYDGEYGDEYDYAYPGWDSPTDPGNANGPGSDLGGGIPPFPPESSPASPPVPSGTPAQITVRVPEDARVWFDGVQMSTPGEVRTYKSPPLAPGNYNYDVRARWNANGSEVTQTQQVKVTPGAHVEVDFPVPPGTAQKPAATQKR